MGKKYILLIAFTLLSLNYLKSTPILLVEDTFSSTSTRIDSLSIKNTLNTTVNAKKFRYFSSLEKFDKIDNVEYQSSNSHQTGYVYNDKGSIKGKELIVAALSMFKTIEKSGNYVDELNMDNLHSLPVALPTVKQGNNKIKLGVAKATFHPQYAKLTVFLMIETPNSDSTKPDQALILGATDIKLSHKGGIIGDSKLSLISQFQTNFHRGAFLLTLKGSFENPSTYARIDCNGFQELAIDGNIQVLSNDIYPVDKDGNKKQQYLSADFKTVVKNLRNIFVSVSLPEFGVKGINKTTFRLNTAVVDFSDITTSESMPSSYLSKYHQGPKELWRGIYIRSLEVVLPKEFSRKSSSKRISFSATNLIIDQQGISGVFQGKNILPIDEGSASNWNFSVERFSLELEANRLVSGGFGGAIVLPISSKKSKLTYDAIFQENNYKLTVKNKDTLDFNALGRARVTLYNNSYIEMLVKDHKFRPKALLNGEMNIITDLNAKNQQNKANNKTKEKVVNFKGVEFQKLVLQTEAPVISVGYAGMKGEMKLANFPISIDELRFTAGNSKMALRVGCKLNLMSEKDGGNSGSASVVIKGKKDPESHRWKFDGVDIGRISIKMDFEKVQVGGSVIIFENDATYGTGFAGAVSLTVKAGKEFGVNAKALFGRTKEFRYWFADAQVTIDRGVPIFTGFSLNTFGGGVYSRMKMDGRLKKDQNYMDVIGASSSGIIYKPDKNNTFGFKASVGMVAEGSPKLFNATVEFGMSFRNSGGLEKVYLKGSGNLMSKLPGNFFNRVSNNLTKISKNVNLPRVTSASSSISVDVGIEYDFVNNIFQATSAVYIDVGFMKGVGSGGKAGWLDFYISPSKWHLLLGTPEDPVGVKMDLFIVEAKVSAYFMAGHNLPTKLTLPHHISTLLNNKDRNSIENDNLDSDSLSKGKGLGFGANLKIDTGDLTFLIFYAHFAAGVGFDVLLQDYKDAHCKGSSGPVGINGWYARGRVYAYLKGELGLTFRLFFKKRKIPIIKSATALILQAKLPNPSWMQGYLVGTYDLLGGLISGRYRFKMELGKKCEIVGGSPLGGVEVIADMTPDSGSNDVDVFTAPQVVFNVPVGNQFTITSDEGKTEYYRIKLDSFSILNEDKEIAGTIEWNSGNTVAALYSSEILPPKTKLKAKAIVYFQKYESGTWKTVMSDGKISKEEKEVEFTTGVAPDHIPLHNISYMYPVLDQKYFLTKEHRTGYIQLNRGQNYLFPDDMEKKIVFNSDSGSLLEETYQYKSSDKRISFNMPDLLNKNKYNTKLMLIAEKNDIDTNVKEITKKEQLNTGNTLVIKEKEAKGAISAGEDMEILTYDFKTSKYNTFIEKMSKIKSTTDAVIFGKGNRADVRYLTQRIESIGEVFGLIDLIGSRYTGNTPLIKAVAVLDDRYYKEKIYPIIYNNFSNGLSISRDVTIIGAPPREAVVPMDFYVRYLENNYENSLRADFPFKYYTAHYYYDDFIDLRTQISTNGLSKNYPNLMNNSFPVMLEGTYGTDIQYILPGDTKKGKYRFNFKKL